MKLIPSLFLLTTAALCISTTAQAGEPTVLGDARPITGDSRGGSWTEIVVNLRTTKPAPLHGQLEVYERNNNEERLVDRRDVDLPLPNNRIHVPVLASRSYHLRFIDDKRKSEWHGSVSPETAGYGSLLFDYRNSNGTVDETRPSFSQRSDVTVASLQAMPRSAWTYDRTALFIIDAAMLGDNVDEPACTALFDWMRTGGTLAVVSPNIDGKSEPLRCGQEPLTTQTVGSGRLVTIDKQGIESSTLLNTSIEKRPNRPSSHDLVFLDRADYAPRVALAGILVVLFGALIGPGLFLYRRRRNNKTSPTRVFAFFGATSLATLGAMLLLGRAFAPSRHTTSTVVRDLTSGNTNGRVVQTRVFHKPESPVRTTRSMQGSLLGEEESNGPSSQQRGAFRIDEDGKTIVLNEQRPSVDDYVYLVESAPYRLEGGKPITISCTQNACIVDNASSIPLEQARLYTASHGFVDVGSIDAGSKRTVTLASKNGPHHLDYRSDRPEDQLAIRAGKHVSLIARQSRAPQPTIVNVTCVSGCEAAR